MPSLQLLQLTDRGRGLLASRRSVGRLGSLTHSPTSLFSLSLAVLANCVPHRRHLCATNQEDARRCLRRRACRWSSGVRPLEPEPEEEASGGESRWRRRCIGRQWGWCRRWIGCSKAEKEWPQISAFPRCYPTQEDWSQWHALPSRLGVNSGRFCHFSLSKVMYLFQRFLLFFVFLELFALTYCTHKWSQCCYWPTAATI